MHTQSQIHTLTWGKRHTYEHMKDAHRTINLAMWDCHPLAWHSCFSMPAQAGHYGMWRVDRGHNHKFGMSHGQTGKIYYWSGSTSAAWCCGFRMPGMGWDQTPALVCSPLLATGWRSHWWLEWGTSFWQVLHPSACICISLGWKNRCG